MKSNIFKTVFQGIAAFFLVFLLSLTAQAKTQWRMALGDAAGGTQWEVGSKFAQFLEKETAVV